MDSSHSHVDSMLSAPYRNVEHWKMSNLYFWVSFPMTFAKDYIFGSKAQLVSTDLPGVFAAMRQQFPNLNFEEIP